jgi:hypothetical protein
VGVGIEPYPCIGLCIINNGSQTATTVRASSLKPGGSTTQVQKACSVALVAPPMAIKAWWVSWVSKATVEP